MCFPVNFANFSRTPFLQNPSGGLLLKRSDFQTNSIYSIFNYKKYIHVKLLGPNIWEAILSKIKQLEGLEVFKRTIKRWKPTLYTC